MAHLTTTMCSSLIISAYAMAEDFNDHSPAFELCRHMRNAAAHGNQFNFRANQPSRPAEWKRHKLNHRQKGRQNPKHGQNLLHDFIAVGDVAYFLLDVQAIINAPKP